MRQTPRTTLVRRLLPAVAVGDEEEEAAALVAELRDYFQLQVQTMSAIETRPAFALCLSSPACLPPYINAMAPTKMDAMLTPNG